ncbi:hypothetical protein AFCDBAGC_2975 [Methylobacterium cerastii]|uniref:Uncharacterized protein n=1 Tax=Methylobacterium cerastii TaxID=932741 RepID=A0ABQ4QIL6_9HYPH|nr:hypothetical protein AFCDBAGC_2975 [Methylobacterium cerastii]
MPRSNDAWGWLGCIRAPLYPAWACGSGREERPAERKPKPAEAGAGD